MLQLCRPGGQRLLLSVARKERKGAGCEKPARAWNARQVLCSDPTGILCVGWTAQIKLFYLDVYLDMFVPTTAMGRMSVGN